MDEFNEAVDWNTELISQMRSDLTEKWNDLERDLPATSLDIDELIKRRLRALKARLMSKCIKNDMKQNSANHHAFQPTIFRP